MYIDFVVSASRRRSPEGSVIGIAGGFDMFLAALSGTFIGEKAQKVNKNEIQTGYKAHQGLTQRKYLE
jgi:hypothetical protein